MYKTLQIRLVRTQIILVNFLHSSLVHFRWQLFVSRCIKICFVVSATSPEPRQCPHFGKFEVTSLMRSDRNVRSLKHGKRSRYESVKYGKTSTYVVSQDGRSQRIKRVDQDSDCDNEGFTNLIIGCNSIDTMEFRSECFSPDLISCMCLIIVEQ